MKFTPGLILRIKDYKFEDDGSTRDKYSVVLYADDEQAYLIHTLTTTQNNLSVPEAAFGCSVYKNIPYFFIPQGQVWGDAGFYFDKNTFIFFLNNVRREKLEKLEKAAAASIFGIAALGKLSNEELKRLIKCALKSKFVPEEIVKQLTEFKNKM